MIFKQYDKNKDGFISGEELTNTIDLVAGKVQSKAFGGKEEWNKI